MAEMTEAERKVLIAAYIKDQEKALPREKRRREMAALNTDEAIAKRYGDPFTGK